MAQPQVLIAGAGPTGLAAALFLARRGVRARIVDSAAAPVATSRALAVNPRTLELLEETGVTARILARGRALVRLRFYRDWAPLAVLDLSRAHPRYPMTVLSQARTEAMLTEALADEGITVERGLALDDIDQTGDGVDVRLARGDGSAETAAAEILFAADGAHSRARHCLGLGFDGSVFPEDWPLCDLELDAPLRLDAGHACFARDGLVFMIALEPGLWRVFGNVPDPLARLPAGSTAGDVVWQSSFRIAHRVASAARVGRVALGGDAAHIHSPVGARGMNLGIEDAWVFASCAAQALADGPAHLADYGRLRLPVHRSVVRRIELLTRLARGRPAAIALLRSLLIPALTALPPAAARMRRTVTGLDHAVRSG